MTTHPEPTIKLNQLADQFGVSNIARYVLADPRFPIWSASGAPDKHHYGKGGLAKHTLQVVELCLLNNEYFRYNEDRQVFLAALFHDCGKMWDYAPKEASRDIVNGLPKHADYHRWEYSPHKRLIHHISRSALVWQEAAISGIDGDTHWLTLEYIDEVLHAILSHHGSREWGSPVAPKSRLAWLLHLCDSLSARIDDADTFDRF